MTENSLYLENVTEFPHRKVRSVYEPSDVSELKDILKKANQDKYPLYPISTGHNWGLGSKLPVTDSDILNLKNLNDIIEVNRELRYARIQPGVTQKQLSEYLEQNAPDLILNVTGSDSGSSVLGNILERGSGKNGHRADDLRELKVILADGEELSTGYGNLPTPFSYYKYGLGADMTHLFTQSNLAVAVEGVVNLMLRQPFTLYLSILKRAELGNFLHAYSELLAKDIIGHSLELDSQNDPKIFELFEGMEVEEDVWIGWFVIYGDRELRGVKEKRMIEALSEVTVDIKTYASEDDNSNSPIPVKVRIDRYHGIPNDHSLIASAKAFGVDFDGDEIDIDLHKEMPGFRCVLPVLPIHKLAGEAIDTVYACSEKYGFTPAISLIGLNDYALESFIRVYFNRNDQDQIQRATDWAEALYDDLKTMGVYAYRLDVESMQPYLRKLQDPSFVWKTKIKQLFDPENIIAPKRYSLK